MFSQATARLGAAVLVATVSAVAAGAAAPSGVPANLEVPDHVAFFQAHAAGTQNYVCLPTATGGVAWKQISPTATLFVKILGAPFQAVTHFLSLNPEEPGVARATWQHSIDTSRVWAKSVEMSTDAAFVAPGAIPWLKLEVVGRQAGPTGGRFLTQARFIQRIHTAGGSAPPTGCGTTAEVGAVALVPYAADYVFFRRVTP
jgi:hypothetical protein